MTRLRAAGSGDRRIAFCKSIANGTYPLEASAKVIELLPKDAVDALRDVLDQAILAIYKEGGLI
jgi:hypothetical protein